MTSDKRKKFVDLLKDPIAAWDEELYSKVRSARKFFHKIGFPMYVSEQQVSYSRQAHDAKITTIVFYLDWRITDKMPRDPYHAVHVIRDYIALHFQMGGHPPSHIDVLPDHTTQTLTCLFSYYD